MESELPSWPPRLGSPTDDLLPSTEAGAYVPNTAVSLKLARALDTTVEELFQIDAEERTQEEVVEAKVISEADGLEPGQLLRMCSVGKTLVAVPPEANGWGLPLADAVLLDPVRKGKGHGDARVRVLNERWKNVPRLLIAGCDPSVSILGQWLQAEGCELIVKHVNSSRALELLQDDLVHIAGTHLVDKATGETDILPITRLFTRNSVVVISYAVWEAGLVTAQGNPKHIANVADLLAARFVSRTARPGLAAGGFWTTLFQGIASLRNESMVTTGSQWDIFRRLVSSGWGSRLLHQHARGGSCAGPGLYSSCEEAIPFDSSQVAGE